VFFRSDHEVNWFMMSCGLSVIRGSVIGIALLPSPQVFDLVVAAVLIPLGAWHPTAKGKRSIAVR
jgi:hypothetical protein